MRGNAATARGVIALVILLLVPAAAAARIDILLPVENPIRGVPVEVSVTGDGAGAAHTLVVVYRPGSQTESVDEPVEIGPSGSVTWTPRDAGITRLGVLDEAGEEVASRNVAVRFPSPPATGLAIFFFAGALLFGGASFAMRRALEGGEPGS